MERLAIDVLGPLPLSSRGNKYILIAADYFTKWVEAYPLANQEAVTVAEVLIREFVSRFGVPLILHSDQGRNFESAVFRDVQPVGDYQDQNHSPSPTVRRHGGAV